jgi:hypothetical protein
MADMPRHSDGPSMEQYIETRLNLLTVAIEKMDAALRERIAGVEAVRDALKVSVDERFIHTDRLNEIVQESAKRAIDKAESAQHAHNVAANEWRSTLNDFKNTLVSRAEYDRLERDFSAYRLEMSRLLAANEGSKRGAKEFRDDSKSMWALVIAVGSAVIAFVIAFLKP